MGVALARALEQLVAAEAGPDEPHHHRSEQAGHEARADDSGCPGNATAVATSTTGLIAGAESRNVSAAAAGAPRETSRPAIGTEPHSQPGSAAPATAATGTAYAGAVGQHAGQEVRTERTPRSPR